MPLSPDSCLRGEKRDSDIVFQKAVAREEDTPDMCRSRGSTIMLKQGPLMISISSVPQKAHVVKAWSQLEALLRGREIMSMF
jgi:hypothetical protein